jgi:hypothetical protein
VGAHCGKNAPSKWKSLNGENKKAKVLICDWGPHKMVIIIKSLKNKSKSKSINKLSIIISPNFTS